jgi:hypothetical protein
MRTQLKRALWALYISFPLVAFFVAFGMHDAKPQGQVGPANLITCNQVAAMAPGPTTIQAIIPPTAGRAINVCGWHVTNTGASGTFNITRGTQTTTPCDTNSAVIVPAMSVSNTAPSADHPGYAFVSTPTGQGVCVTPSVATIAIVIYYSLS